MYKIEPKHLEGCISDYEVVGYFENMAIISDEVDDLYFVDNAKDIIPIGSVVASDEVSPITELTQEQQVSINQMFKK